MDFLKYIRNDLKMVDINSMCRTCMNTNEFLLFNLNQMVDLTENNSISLIQLILECTSLQVNDGDGLPQNLCLECVQFLKSMYKFRIRVHEVDLQYKELFCKDELKVEVKAEIDKVIETNPNKVAEQECKDDIKDEVEAEDVKDDFTYFDGDIDYDDYNLDVPKEEPALQSYECEICNKVYVKNDQKSHNCQECDQNIRKLSRLHNQKKKNRYVGDKTDETTHECSQCDRTFRTRRALSAHMITHNLKCTVCSKEFKKSSDLRRHMKIHNGEMLKCDKCPKTYTRMDQLNAHVRSRHEGVKPYTCGQCPKAFYQLCNLKDHLRTHTGETPYLCSECGKSFNSRSNLRQHTLRHTGVKPWPCKLCPKSFTTKGQLKIHMATHTGSHPYKCEECGGGYTTMSSLRKHLRTHLNIKPFECDVCGKRFTCNDHLKRHNLIHTGEKPYSCSICSYSFRQSNDLVKHLRIHMGPNIYSCSICSMKFRLQSDLKKHYPEHYKNGENETKSPELNDLIVDNQNDVQKETESNNTITIVFSKYEGDSEITIT